MNDLLAQIAKVLPELNGWCPLDKATKLAELIVECRPKLVVEIGVWTGSSCIPMLLALKHNGSGRAIAIDPWSPTISVINEVEANVEWWGKVDHSAAMRTFLGAMEALHVSHLCEVWRRPSDECVVPEQIDLLHIDGSHTEQAVRDVNRYASKIRVNGTLVMDDLAWEGGAVRRAYDRALELGFLELYPLGTGCVMRRDHLGA